MTNETGTTTGRWLMGVSSIAILVALVLVFGYLVPNFRVHAREAEARQNLHTIQLALERYCVDSIYRSYPPWLLGGCVSDLDLDKTDKNLSADPLQSEGYLSKYPVNPFMRNERNRTMLANFQENANDPFRPNKELPGPPAYRFGSQHDLMGVVLQGISKTNQVGQIYSEFRFDGKQTGAEVSFPVQDSIGDNRIAQWKQGQLAYLTIPETQNFFSGELKDQFEWRQRLYSLPHRPGGYSIGILGCAGRGTEKSGKILFEGVALHYVLEGGVDHVGGYSGELQEMYEVESRVKRTGGQ